MARYVPVADTLGNEPTRLRTGYPLHLITQRDIRHTKARTITHPYLTDLMPENGIILHTKDAKNSVCRLGIRSVVSATNPDGGLGSGQRRQKADDRHGPGDRDHPPGVVTSPGPRPLGFRPWT